MWADHAKCRTYYGTLVVSDKYITVAMTRNITYWTSVDVMLGQRLQRWPTIKQTLVRSQILMSQQTRFIELMLIKYWASVADGGTTLNQHWVQ